MHCGTDICFFGGGGSQNLQTLMSVFLCDGKTTPANLEEKKKLTHVQYKSLLQGILSIT